MRHITGHRLGRRRALSGSAATVFAATSLLPSGGFAQPKTETVNLQLGWIAGNGQTGEIVARHLGYFEEARLNVVIQPGGPSIDGVAMVASGRNEIGHISSSPSLMLAASQKIPVTCFAVGMQEHPYTFFSLAKKPIRSPADMVGKKIGIQATGRILLSALLKKHGIAEKDVEVVIIGSDLSPVLTGQADAVSGWLTAAASLRMLGPERVDLRLWDCGIRLYAMPYYATKTTIERRLPMLAAYIGATARGWGFAHDNPDKAADMLVKEYPNFKRDDEVVGIKASMPFAFNATTKAKGWGTFEPAVWGEQIRLYDELKQFAGGPPRLEDVMTLSVLEATKDVRPRIG